MRAIVIELPGGPEVLTLRDIPTPEPALGQVRIRVEYAGVNRADLMQRAGHYPAPPGVPADIPGLEYAGIVEAVGPGASRFSTGDRVYGLVAGGAYAEQIVIHEREVAPIPAGLSTKEAAAIPEAFLTAYDALVAQARLAPGERVLIHAAGSGVGTAAVQIARALGCFVIGTSRTAEKLERARELGLDAGLLTRDGSFAAAVLDATAKSGVDVVLELVGGAYVAEDLRAMAQNGRIVLVGLTAGTKGEIDLGMLLRKRVTLKGTVMRSRPLEEKIQAAQLLERSISPWVAKRIVKPVVDRVFPLEEAAAAHTYVAADESFGKVLLRVSAPIV